MAVATQESVQASPAKRGRWLIPIAVVILAGCCIVGSILAFRWPFSSQNVIDSVKEDWPGTITVQRFYRTYFPHPGCVLENVALNRKSAAPGPPLVMIQKVTVEADYHDLFLRPGYIHKIVLEGLRISVPVEQPETEKTSAGSNQTAKSSNSSVRLGEVFTKDASLEIARKNDEALKFAIHELRLNSITGSSRMSYDVAMRNAEPPGEIRSRGKLGPWDSQHLDSIPLSGTYTFDQADLGVFKGIAGTLSGKGEFHGALGRIETQGTTDTPNFAVSHSHHAVSLKTKYTATVDGTGGDTILRSVDGTFLHTAVHIEGSVATKPGQPGKTTSLNLNVRGAHIDDVLWLFVRASKAPLKGTANFHAHIVWPSGPQAFLKRVVLQGDFEIEHGQWENPERQSNLNMLSKRASGNKKDKNTDEVTADIKGGVALSDGIAKFHDVSFEMPGAEARLHGNYDLETTKIDFHGDLRTTSSISNDSTGAKAILLKPLDPLFKRKRAGAVVPVAMIGTYSRPQFGIALPGK